MSTTSYTAGEVMDRAASLLNDTAKSTYTYIAQLPYLRTAADELKNEFELNNIPITNLSSQIIPVEIGDIQITDVDGAPPNYPGDLVEIQQLHERLADTDDPFIPMTQMEFLPHYLDTVAIDSLIYWTWQDQKIKFCPAGCTTDREVKIDYIGDIFGAILDENFNIGIIGAKNFLAFRTACLCAKYIMQNKEKSDELGNDAQIAIDQILSINIKGKQSVTTRKRPFRASYRSRGIW